MKLPTNYSAIVAAGGWNLSTAFLSAKAKAQLRDSKGRFIPMGGMVRWLDTNGWRWGFVTHVGEDGSVKIRAYDGKDYHVPNKQLEVVKAIIPSNHTEAKALTEAIQKVKSGTTGKPSAPKASAPGGAPGKALDHGATKAATKTPDLASNVKKGDIFSAKQGPNSGRLLVAQSDYNKSTMSVAVRELKPDNSLGDVEQYTSTNENYKTQPNSINKVSKPEQAFAHAPGAPVNAGTAKTSTVDSATLKTGDLIKRPDGSVWRVTKEFFGTGSAQSTQKHGWMSKQGSLHIENVETGVKAKLLGNDHDPAFQSEKFDNPDEVWGDGTAPQIPDAPNEDLAKIADKLTPIDPGEDPEPLLYVDTAGFKKVGGQSGSNPGGIYEGPDGTQYYVKKAQTEQHAANEVLAAHLYQKAGVNVPDVYLTELDGGPAVASKIVPGLTPLFPHGNTTPETLKDARHGFAMDSWLANWDSIGLVYDNMMKDKNGHAVRVDTGGAMLYRAQGEPKGGLFGDTVGETETLRSTKNAQAHKIFGGMSNVDVAMDVMKTVDKVTDEDIAKLVDELPFSSDAVKADLKQTLKNRRADLHTKFDIPTPAEATALEEKYAPKAEPDLSAHGPLAKQNVDGTVSTLAMSFKNGDLMRLPDGTVAEISKKNLVQNKFELHGLTGPQANQDFSIKFFKANKHDKVLPESELGKAALAAKSKPEVPKAPGGVVGEPIGIHAPEGVNTTPTLAANLKVGDIVKRASGWFQVTEPFDHETKNFKAKKLDPDNPYIAGIDAPSTQMFSVADGIPNSVKHLVEPPISQKIDDAIAKQAAEPAKIETLKAPGEPDLSYDQLQAFQVQAIPTTDIQVGDVLKFGPGVSPGFIKVEENNGKGTVKGTMYTSFSPPIPGSEKTFHGIAVKVLSTGSGDKQTNSNGLPVFPEDTLGFGPHPTVQLKNELDEEELSVLDDYTGTLAYDINGYLRKGLEPSSWSIGQIKNKISILDGATSKSEFMSDGIVYRGFKAKHLPTTQMPPGTVLPDPGFVSTSTSYKIGKKFAAENGLHGAIMEIQVKKGQFGLDVTHADLSGFESEIILPRNSKFVVIEDGVRSNGVRYTKVELVQGEVPSDGKHIAPGAQEGLGHDTGGAPAGVPGPNDGLGTGPGVPGGQGAPSGVGTPPAALPKKTSKGLDSTPVYDLEKIKAATKKAGGPHSLDPGSQIQKITGLKQGDIFSPAHGAKIGQWYVANTDYSPSEKGLGAKPINDDGSLGYPFIYTWGAANNPAEIYQLVDPTEGLLAPTLSPLPPLGKQWVAAQYAFTPQPLESVKKGSVLQRTMPDGSYIHDVMVADWSKPDGAKFGTISYQRIHPDGTLGPIESKKAATGQTLDIAHDVWPSASAPAPTPEAPGPKVNPYQLDYSPTPISELKKGDWVKLDTGSVTPQPYQLAEDPGQASVPGYLKYIDPSSPHVKNFWTGGPDAVIDAHKTNAPEGDATPSAPGGPPTPPPPGVPPTPSAPEPEHSAAKIGAVVKSTKDGFTGTVLKVNSSSGYSLVLSSDGSKKLWRKWNTLEVQTPEASAKDQQSGDMNGQWVELAKHLPVWAKNTMPDNVDTVFDKIVNDTNNVTPEEWQTVQQYINDVQADLNTGDQGEQSDALWNAWLEMTKAGGWTPPVTHETSTNSGDGSGPELSKALDNLFVELQKQGLDPIDDMFWEPGFASNPAAAKAWAQETLDEVKQHTDDPNDLKLWTKVINAADAELGQNSDSPVDDAAKSFAEQMDLLGGAVSSDAIADAHTALVKVKAGTATPDDWARLWQVNILANHSDPENADEGIPFESLQEAFWKLFPASGLDFQQVGNAHQKLYPDSTEYAEFDDSVPGFATAAQFVLDTAYGEGMSQAGIGGLDPTWSPEEMKDWILGYQDELTSSSLPGSGPLHDAIKNLADELGVPVNTPDANHTYPAVPATKVKQGDKVLHQGTEWTVEQTVTSGTSTALGLKAPNGTHAYPVFTEGKTVPLIQAAHPNEPDSSSQVTTTTGGLKIGDKVDGQDLGEVWTVSEIYPSMVVDGSTFVAFESSEGYEVSGHYEPDTQWTFLPSEPALTHAGMIKDGETQLQPTKGVTADELQPGDVVYNVDGTKPLFKILNHVGSGPDGDHFDIESLDPGYGKQWTGSPYDQYTVVKGTEGAAQLISGDESLDPGKPYKTVLGQELKQGDLLMHNNKVIGKLGQATHDPDIGTQWSVQSPDDGTWDITPVEPNEELHVIPGGDPSAKEYFFGDPVQVGQLSVGDQIMDGDGDTGQIVGLTPSSSGHIAVKYDLEGYSGAPFDVVLKPTDDTFFKKVGHGSPNPEPVQVAQSPDKVLGAQANFSDMKPGDWVAGNGGQVYKVDKVTKSGPNYWIDYTNVGSGNSFHHDYPGSMSPFTWAEAPTPSQPTAAPSEPKLLKGSDLKPGDTVYAFNDPQFKLLSIAEVGGTALTTWNVEPLSAHQKLQSTKTWTIHNNSDVKASHAAPGASPTGSPNSPGDSVSGGELHVGDWIQWGSPGGEQSKGLITSVAETKNGAPAFAMQYQGETHLVKKDLMNAWEVVTPPAPASGAKKVGDPITPAEVVPGMVVGPVGSKYKVNSVKKLPGGSYSLDITSLNSGVNFPSHTMTGNHSGWILHELPSDAAPTAPQLAPGSPIHLPAEIKPGMILKSAAGDQYKVNSIEPLSHPGKFKANLTNLSHGGEFPDHIFSGTLHSWTVVDAGTGAPETVSTPSAPSAPTGTLVAGSSHVFQDATGKRYVVNKLGHVLYEGDTVTTNKGETGQIKKFELDAKYAKIKIAGGKTKVRQIDTLKKTDGTTPAATPAQATPAAPAGGPLPEDAPWETPPPSAAPSVQLLPGWSWESSGSKNATQFKKGDIVGKTQQEVEWAKPSVVKAGKYDVQFVGDPNPLTISKNNPWEVWEKVPPDSPPNADSVKKNPSSLKKHDFVKHNGQMLQVDSITEDLDGGVSVKFKGKAGYEPFLENAQVDYFGNAKKPDPNPSPDLPTDVIPGATGKASPQDWQPGDVVGDSSASKLTVEYASPYTSDSSMTEVKFVGISTTYQLPNDTPWMTWPKEDGQPLPGKGGTAPKVEAPPVPEPDVTPEPEAPPAPEPKPIDPTQPAEFELPSGGMITVPVGHKVLTGSSYSGQAIYVTDGLDNWWGPADEGGLKEIQPTKWQKNQALNEPPLFEHPGKVDVTPHFDTVLSPDEKTELLAKMDDYIATADGYYSSKDQVSALRKLIDDPTGDSLSINEWNQAATALALGHLPGITDYPKWAELGSEFVKLVKKSKGTYAGEWNRYQDGPQFHYNQNERKALGSVGLSEDTLAFVGSKFVAPAANKKAAREIHSVASDPEYAQAIDAIFGAGTAKAIVMKTRGDGYKPALSDNGSPYAPTLKPLPSATGKGGQTIKLGDTIIADDSQGGKAELILPDGRIRVRRADGTHFTRKADKFSVVTVDPGSTAPSATPAPSKPFIAKPRPPFENPDWSTPLHGTGTSQQALDAVKDVRVANSGYSFAADHDQIEDLDVHVSRIIDTDGQEVIELKFKVTPKHGQELFKRGSAAGWSIGFMQVQRRTMPTDGKTLAKVSASQFAAVSNHHNGRTMRHTTGDGARVQFHQITDIKNVKQHGDGGPYAYHNMMQIRIPANKATPDVIAKAMYDAGIDTPGPADNSALKRFAENRLLSILGGQTNANTETLGSKRDDLLTQITNQWGITWEDLTVHHGMNGRIELRLPESVAKKMIQSTGVKVFHHNLHNGKKDFIDMVKGPHQGLLSTTTRWSEGVPQGGMSSPSDIVTGGADYVFLSPKQTAYGGLEFDASRLFMRTDFYANSGDKFGFRNTNIDVLSQIYHGAYETMFKQRVSLDDALGYIVSPSERDDLINQLKAMGITEIGGRTVEQFIVTDASQFTPPPPLAAGPAGGPAV